MNKYIFFFIFSFLTSIIIMGAAFYFMSKLSAIVYYTLPFYGIISGWVMVRQIKKREKDAYSKLDLIKDSTMLIAAPMNYISNKIIAVGGFGCIYPDRFIFKTTKGNDTLLTIPLSDIQHVSLSNFLRFVSKMTIQLKNGELKKFWVDNDRKDETNEFMKKLSLDK